MHNDIVKCQSLSANSNSAPLKGERWSRAEVELLAELWRKDLPAKEIAAKTGRTERSVVIKASRLGLAMRRFRNAHGAQQYPGKAQLRNCLRCERQFFSEGIGHRICSKCKSDFNWRSGGDRATAPH